MVCDKCNTPLNAAGKCPACTYAQAAALESRAASFGDFETAAKLFLSAGDYEDAAARAASCFARAEDCNREAIYAQAVKRQGVDRISWQGKADLMRSIAGYRDADALATEYQQKADDLAAEAENARREKEEARQADAHRAHTDHKRKRKFLVLGVSTGGAVLAIVLVVSLLILPQVQYKKARKLIEAHKYLAAAEAFSAIVPYSNSEEYLGFAYYSLGMEAVEAGNDLAAADYFTKAGNAKSAPAELQAAKARLYDTALTALREGDFNAAQDAFNAADDYEDAKDYKHFCRALRVWNGDSTANADKMDLKKAENILWKVMDGLWYSDGNEQEISISAATRTSSTPDLKIADNTLRYTADGVSYTVEIHSLTTCRLLGGGEYAGAYDKM
ncbi:MAG: hypothetical protein E7552_02060 [Ruminococcaceae bacterium]|nr:hypothetical protein [Oscillospiraceae bacterium]